MPLELGGQAVMGGVMLRSKKDYAIAVRTLQGNIKTKRFGFVSLTRRYKALGLPLVRGMIATWEMLVIGMQSIIWSSSQIEKEKTTKTELGITIFISLILVVAFFVALPLLFAKMITGNSFLLSLIEGLFRLLIFVGYIWGIGFFSDVKKVYQYHGAEHKVVNCYDAGRAVNLKNAKNYSTLHPRCGTSFIFIIFALSVILFAFITAPSWWIKFIERIMLVPLIAGLGFETLKISARFKHNPLIKLIIYPGLFIQHITTKEPSDKQLMVAIASFKALKLPNIARLKIGQ